MINENIVNDTEAIKSHTVINMCATCAACRDNCTRDFKKNNCFTGYTDTGETIIVKCDAYHN